jgi:homoserine O-succinyltransferase
MPDSALEDTEIQFSHLLGLAAEELVVSLKLVSLPNVPRSEKGRQRLAEYYYGIEELWNHAYDAVIITGTEPQQANLKQEPYWGALADLFEWAERNTASTILSCLAAHAAVLQGDGVPRVRLADKQFGVYEFACTEESPLTRKTSGVLRFPHSRWNEVQAEALTACGYQVLSSSPDAGVDCFVKRRGASWFVHFQGHPEYQELTLFKEYRRDVRRYLRGERETYPNMPAGYFRRWAEQHVFEFREKAMANRIEGLMCDFPEAMLTHQLENDWQSSSVRLYSNWFDFLLARKAESLCYVPAQARSAVSIPVSK